MKPKKLNCLEGVRALSCLGVVLCHFQNGFFPNSRLAHMMFKTPLYYLFSGNTAVRVLFTLSGFVLCYKYFRSEDYSGLEQDAVKRYFRLMLPTLAVTMLAYAMMKFGLMWNAEAAAFTGSQEFMGTFNRFEPSLKTSIAEGTWKSLFQGASGYVGPLWTMQYEMLGSYFILAAAAVLKSRRSRYVFYAAYLLLFHDYYNYFVLGMMICDLYTHEEKVNRFFAGHQAVTVVLHIAAWCYIGVITNLDVFRWRSLGFDIALLVMFLTLLNSRVLDRVWGCRAGVTIGKHGFSIYLLHWPVIECFSCGFFLYLTGIGMPHKWVVLADLILTFPVVIGVSALFTKAVVEPSVRLSNQAAALVMGGWKKSTKLKEAKVWAK